MADQTIPTSGERRYALAGRKQTEGHVRKRVSAVAAARAAWSPEKRAAVRNNFSLAQLNRSPDSKEASALKKAVSERREATAPVTIYALIDPRGDIVRYVGKTCATADRRFRRHRQLALSGTRRHVYNWWRSVVNDGSEPMLAVLEIVPVGGDWVEAEQRWIAQYRATGAGLSNQCDGGQGTAGMKFSSEHRENLRLSHLGKKIPAEQLVRRSLSLRAAFQRNPRRPMSAESYAQRTVTRAERRATGLYKKRKPATDETKAKISASKLAKRLALAGGEVGSVKPIEELRAVRPTV